MFGKLPIKEKIKHALRRRRLALYVFASLFLAIISISLAIGDFIVTARQKDQQLQVAGLKSELAQFILALRDDEGLSLLDNSFWLGRELRPISILSANKSFFTYFLQRENARSFNKQNIKWDPPKSCVVEFTTLDGTITPRGDVFRLHACFAVVPTDPNGRYVYFSLRYPDHKIIRHKRGDKISASDRVSLYVKGSRTTRLELVFEPTALALSRYPSHKNRFSGVHEVTAYWSETPQQPARFVNAQAYEHLIEDEFGNTRNFVTILGRMDASILFPQTNETLAWPYPVINSATIGISIFNTDVETVNSKKQIEISPIEKGRSLRSLEGIYLSQVISKAYLDITAYSPQNNAKKFSIWKSSTLLPDKEFNKSIAARYFQKITDWWAGLFFPLTESEKKIFTIHQKIDGRIPVSISLQAEPILMPDIVTRSFFWLTLALATLLFMLFVWLRVIARIRRILETAYRMTVSPSFDGDLDSYLKNKDETGSLARTFSVLLKRARSRSALIIEKTKKEQQKKAGEIKLAQENVKASQSILAAIGHEIRSPLQSLDNQIPENSDLKHLVKKMTYAVTALTEATSIEAAFKDGKYVVKVADIAAFISRLAKNLLEQGIPIQYKGPATSVSAAYDSILLDIVLAHILDNATDRRHENSKIYIELMKHDYDVSITVSNSGPTIPEESLESIFDLGYTTGSHPNNLGQGLFVSRMYVVGMKGTIKAENRDDGVSIILTLPASI
jgi:signal transduction histidine kinase